MKIAKFGLGFLKLFAIAVVAGMLFGISPTLPFCGLVLLSATVPMPHNALMGTVLESWATYIMERFWKDNGFLKNVYSDDQYVLQGRIVHIPQPGSKPAVQKNRTVFPATSVRRTDTDTLYSLDEYSTDPTHIPNIDSIHLSYSKQDSVMGDHMSVLNEIIAEDLLIKWGADAAVVLTTGGALGVKTAQNAPGQTGNRYTFHHKDLQNLMIKMNVDNVPKTDRFVLIDDNMFGGFYDSLSETNAKDFSRYADAENGVIGKLHGFSIITRSSVVAATNANTIKALGAVLAATDNLCSLAWHKNSIAAAIGDKKLFQNLNDALYMGDVHSALVMAGGRVRRADGKGVYLITQGAAA